MDTIKNELIDMLDRGRHTNRPINAYVGDDNLVAYIRVTRRYINSNMCATIDIANITVSFDKENTGIFKKFMSMVESLATQYQRVVFIESVLDDILLEKLPTYGYSLVNNSMPPSFYK